MATETREPRTVVKEVDYAKLYSDGTILVKEVRASYPHIGEAYKGDDSDSAAYSITGLMPRTKKYQAAKDLLRDETNRLLKEHKVNLAPDKKFLRDGDLSGKDEAAGMYTISAREQRRPQARDRSRDPKTGKPKILSPAEAEEKFYGGCWVNILIRPWYQNNKWGKRVNAGLVAVQFVRDDESFGQGRISDASVDETFDDDDSGYDDAIGEDEDL